MDIDPPPDLDGNNDDDDDDGASDSGDDEDNYTPEELERVEFFFPFYLLHLLLSFPPLIADEISSRDGSEA